MSLYEGQCDGCGKKCQNADAPLKSLDGSNACAKPAVGQWMLRGVFYDHKQWVWVWLCAEHVPRIEQGAKK